MQQLGHVRRRRDDDGAAAVEFALVVPILLIVVLGIINFGVVLAQDLALGNGAREAARFAAVQGPTCDQIRLKAASLSMETIAHDLLENEVIDPGCSAAPPCEGSTTGASARVTVNYTSKFMVPMPIPGFPTGVDIEGTGEFRCEFS